MTSRIVPTHPPRRRHRSRRRNTSARFLGGERSSGWSSKAVPLVFYVLLGICITLSVYLVLDWLLEQQREESRLKPKGQKRRRPAQPCRRMLVNVRPPADPRWLRT